MNEAERNRTVNWIVTIAIGLLVALLVGTLFGFLVAKSHFHKESGLGATGGPGATGTAAAQQFVAVLTIDGSGNCTQTLKGDPDAVAHLSISNGDTIEWQPSAATTIVTFANVAPSGPFDRTTLNGQSGFVGPARNALPNDYRFTSDMRVDAKPCNNYQLMGVHVSK